MKYIKQTSIILIVSLLAELLAYVIPFPAPASVYGLVIMFLLLCTHIVKLEDVENVADFVGAIMPFFFIGPTVKIMCSFDIIKGHVGALVIVCIVSTIVTTAVTGLVSSFVINIKKNGRGKKNA